MPRSAAALLTLGGVFATMVLASVVWFTGAVAAPEIPKATQGEQCVADTDLMRKNHMDMLNHQRDNTVIEGVRGEPFSLVGCVNCHAQQSAAGEPIRIDAEGQFCQSCHAYAAVKIDCFSCHAAVPEQAQQIGLLNQNAPYVAQMAVDHSGISYNHLTERHAKQPTFRNN